jgi:hypothetical protein
MQLDTSSEIHTSRNHTLTHTAIIRSLLLHPHIYSIKPHYSTT